jgi:hypothetical protein
MIIDIVVMTVTIKIKYGYFNNKIVMLATTNNDNSGD